MKKILYMTTISDTINSFLVPHIKMIKEEGHIVDCACCIERAVDEDLINNGVKVYDLPLSRNPLDLNNLKAFKELIRIQNENKYDIIHVHTPVAGVYGRLLKTKFKDIKVIYTAHGFHFFEGAPKANWLIYYPIEKIMSKLTDTIITINDEDYNKALSFNIKETYKINGVGLDLDLYKDNKEDGKEIRKKLNIKENEFVMTMIAEVNKNKNHKQMIEALKILKSKGTNVKVLCAGDGDLFDDIKEEVKNENLDDNIKMLGYRDDIEKIISACDAGLLLSYREGLPRNIMELMACGKPVIGTNIRGIRDIIQDEENGYLIDVEDAESLAKKIELLSSNRDLLRKMSESALKSSRKYDIRQILKDMKDMVM